MPERDVTGQSVQKTLKTISNLRHRMQEKIPYGPLREYMTKQETRLMLQNVDPAAKQQLIRRVGDEEWRRMMEDLYGTS